MNEVAIVILNFNGAQYLIKFLPSVLKFSQGCRVIVADNFSTDNSVEILQKSFPSVEILQLKENHGYSQGYNEALDQIDAEIFVLLNSDVEVTKSWWETSVELLKSSDKIAAVQPKLLSYHEKTMFEYAGAGGGFIDKLGYPFCRGRIFQSMEKDENQYDDIIPVFWASGACLFIKADKFREAGGFDPGFFAHMEEIDLCWRLQKAGNQIYYNGKSHVFHVGGGTLEKSHPRKTFLNFRNGLTLLYKNYTTSQLYTLLPLRFVLDWIAAIKFTLFDNRRHGIAVLRAHKFFIRNIKDIHQKRRSLNKLPNTHIKTIYPKSIVNQYFIRGIKSFQRLGFKPN